MIGGQIVLVPLVLLPLGVLFGLLLRGPIEKNAKLNMRDSNRKSGLLIEALEGIETAKASGARSFSLNAGRLYPKPSWLVNFESNASLP